MFTLNKQSAKQYLQKYLTPYLAEKGYLEKNKRDTGIKFIKKIRNGFDGLSVGFIESFPGQRARYSVYKRIDIIEEITWAILKRIEPEKKSDKESVSIAFSPRNVNGLLADNYLPEMENEEDVYICFGLIKKFMEESGFPILEKYSDIKELDNLINGENIWDSDWSQIINLGGHFDIKRIIIAWLAKNPNFEELVEKTFRFFETNPNPDGSYYKYDRKDLTLRLPFTVHYLKSM